MRAGISRIQWHDVRQKPVGKIAATGDPPPELLEGCHAMLAERLSDDDIAPYGTRLIKCSICSFQFNL
ncbi:unnamed protein product [Zymoseptoria tritici ST99CH_1A5]|uniref:Uncharacterized protein n=1 Tax=Zymoseptoria tritici ST99CH_1A5 TaxID=1276529 RepID=A0A1Y6LY43_ZYMTR|nr:unnamed protein product [Zymoseptoria tritici ST99CH_1A5]